MTAAIFSLPIATCFLVAGFWISLFGKLEQRLIDVQMTTRPPEASETPAPLAYEGNPGFGRF